MPNDVSAEEISVALPLSPKSMSSSSSASASGSTSTSGRRASKASGQNGRARPRASVACVSCRQKKTKCDAQNLEPGQSCSMCSSSNIECIIVRNSDRRKIGSRDHITALQGRMESIEALISQYGIAMPGATKAPSRSEEANSNNESNLVNTTSASPPQSTAEEAGSSMMATSYHDSPDSSRKSQEPETILTNHTPVSLNDILERNGPLSILEENPNPPTEASPSMVEDMMITDEVCHDESLPMVLTGPQPHDNEQMILPAQPEQPANNHTHHRSLSINESITSLETDSSPGQTRYFGPTTNLHLQRHGQRHETDSNNSTTTTNNNNGAMVNAMMNTAFGSTLINMDSPHIRDSILRSCWPYYARSVRVVDEHLFMAHRALGQRSQYWSSFLEAALLACGTRISTSPAVRKLGRTYADRAKQDLNLELEQPTVATLQGCLLISDFEATSGRDRVGWIYSGIAFRLLFDLGLHDDCSPLINRGILLKDDANLRHALFLGSFIYDRLWALYLGRPSCIPMTVLDQSSCRFLRPDPPHIIPHIDGDDNHHNPQHHYHKDNTLEHWVTLSRHLSEVTDALNNPIKESAQSVITRLFELSARIRSSHDMLPVPLSCRQISDLDSTGYGLNMQFCGMQIVLHRGLIKILMQNNNNSNNNSSWSNSNNTTEGNGTSTTTRMSVDPDNREKIERSLDTMYDYAVCISRLVLAYREIFGIESFVTIILDNMYLASSTLISHSIQVPSASLGHTTTGIRNNNNNNNNNSTTTTTTTQLSPDTVQLLNVMSDTLESLTKHFPVALKMYRTLSRICENAGLDGVFGAKARSTNVGDDSATAADGPGTRGMSSFRNGAGAGGFHGHHNKNNDAVFGKESSGMSQHHQPTAGLHPHHPSTMLDNSRNLAMGASFLQPSFSGSWGSMEALVHDDFLLGQNGLLGDHSGGGQGGMGADGSFEDVGWPPVEWNSGILA